MLVKQKQTILIIPDARYSVSEWDGSTNVVQVTAVDQATQCVTMRYVDDGLTHLVGVHYFLNVLNAALLQ